MGQNHILQENNQSPVSGNKANAVLWDWRKVRLYVKAAAVTRYLLQNANMAGDGESLESCLSKFLLKLLFSRSLTGREVFFRVLHTYRCPKFRVYSHDIVESETVVELIRLALSESVLRQLLASEGLLFPKISNGVWLFFYLLDSSWPEYKVCVLKCLQNIFFPLPQALIIRSFAENSSELLPLLLNSEGTCKSKNKRDQRKKCPGAVEETTLKKNSVSCV